MNDKMQPDDYIRAGSKVEPDHGHRLPRALTLRGGRGRSPEETFSWRPDNGDEPRQGGVRSVVQTMRSD